MLRKVFLKRQDAYKSVFNTPKGKIVLADLVSFCSVNQPTFSPDNQYVSAFREGRREVFLRINEYLHKDHSEIINLVEKDIYND